MVCHFLVSESAAIRTLMAATEQAYDLIDSPVTAPVERPVSESSVRVSVVEHTDGTPTQLLGDTDLRVTETTRRR